MMTLGEGADRVAGVLSLLLHGLRGVSVNTADDLGPYLDAPVDSLFPPAVVPRDIREHVPLLRLGKRVTRTLRWHSQHVPLCPHYRARHAGEYWLNTHVTARWMQDRRHRSRRALIFVHGWLEPGPWIEEKVLLPRVQEELGVDVLHIQLPFHGSRNPKSALFHGEFFWSADLVRTVESVRQSILDLRTLMAWLRAERGYEEIGVSGVSLGGGITMALACLSEPPDYIVPIVSHLKLGEVVEDAPILWRMKLDLERFGIDRARRKELFDRLGLAALRPALPPERQLWIAAESDVYIKAHLVRQQWHEWGEPPIEWIPGGHMTFPLSIGRVVARMRQFHETLSGAPATPGRSVGATKIP